MTTYSFDLVGPAQPDSPVVISVPHGGREYPPALLDALAVSSSTLVGLEDRYIDAVALEARVDETMLIQRLGRAWIDLNRGEEERDPQVDDGADALRTGEGTLKLRSGLGLVPRRAGPVADLWRRRFSDSDIRTRIKQAYQPYHERLSSLLATARQRWGVAVLLDLHSMPPLGPGNARLVIGDRFGKTADVRFLTRIAAEAAAVRLRTAINSPYAGGQILQRHGAPTLGIHAVQLEVDRMLYLDKALEQPGPGLAATAMLVRRIANALADEALGMMRHAAE